MSETVTSFWSGLRYTRLRDIVRGRFDASLDWRRTIAEADLPPELADAVAQVVSRSRLWRRERVDIAAELTAHFQDGLAAGCTPTELLETFGAPENTAQLIRRAKRRGRPSLWQLWHYGWITALALFIFYIVVGFWMAAGRPAVKTDYLALINKPALAVPEDQRAWPVYRDALLTTGINPTEDLYTDVVTNGGKRNAKDGHAKALEKIVADHPDAIVKLREAANMPKVAFVTSTSHVDFTQKDRDLFHVKITPEEVEAAKHATLSDRWLISTLLPHMQYLRSSGELLAADARHAAAAGDGKTAYADVTAMYGVSRHCEETPFMISLLVADVVQKMASATIRDVLVHHADVWNGDQLRNLAHLMVKARIDWRRGFDGERTCFYDSMQRIYTDNGNGDGRLALQVSRDRNLFEILHDALGSGPNDPTIFQNEAVAFLSLPAANVAVASRKEMTDMYDRVTDRAIARMGTPYWSWADEPTLDDELKSLTDGPIDRFRYLFVRLLVPSYDNVLNRMTVSDGERDGVFIGIALELYHRANNKWPASLDELSPRWLPEVPVDRITGKPLHYQIVDGRPIVYSVGVDGDDDGGKLAKDSGGEVHPENAEPPTLGFKHKPVPAAETNGDWIIWPTAAHN
jgi:hypothetical protein